MKYETNINNYFTNFICNIKNMCINSVCRKFASFLIMKNIDFVNIYQIHKRTFTIKAVLQYSDQNTKSLVKQDLFENVSQKNKETYLDMVHIFETRDIHRRGHVEFIYSALRHMENFGVHKDLEVYKSLINVLPKGKFIPTNVIQAEFMHYPKQQQCIIDLLQQMEDNGVIPDWELEDILLNIFGRRGYPLRKYWRMMYWMPKFKNLSPWPLPTVLPNDSLELAKLAIARITSVDLQTKITTFQTADIKDSIDKTWIVSAQSPSQQELLENHEITKPIYVEGSCRVWLRNTSVNYFILRTDTTFVAVPEQDADDVSNLKTPFLNMVQPQTAIKKIPSVHEQAEGTIIAVCATGTSSRDSLLSWIRHLENNGNPILGKSSIVFALRSPTNDDVDNIPVRNTLGQNQEIRKINEKK